MDGKDIILNLLLSQPYAKLSLDKKEVRMRCPFCGDSKSNRSETNFNVKIADSDNPRYLYICFRASCGQKGYITPEFLRMLNYDNFEANVYLNKINKIASKNKKFTSKGRRSIVNFLSPNNKLSIAKLKYLSTRLGTDLSLKDLMKLKIHTDFKDLYRHNEIDVPVKKISYYDELSKHGLAFLSAYNDYLIVRNVTGTDKIKRYTNIDIFENDDIEKLKFYVIPTKINILSKKPIVINMAEGTFDILSVYFNLNVDWEYKNHIYVSVSGATYESTLMHLIRQYGLIDIIVNIFSDKDVLLDKYENLNKQIRRYTNSLEIKVYYNEMGKDFGVPKSEIKLQENIII